MQLVMIVGSWLSGTASESCSGYEGVEGIISTASANILEVSRANGDVYRLVGCLREEREGRD